MSVPTFLNGAGARLAKISPKKFNAEGAHEVRVPKALSPDHRANHCFTAKFIDILDL